MEIIATSLAVTATDEEPTGTRSAPLSYVWRPGRLSELDYYFPNGTQDLMLQAVPLIGQRKHTPPSVLCWSLATALPSNPCPSQVHVHPGLAIHTIRTYHLPPNKCTRYIACSSRMCVVVPACTVPYLDPSSTPPSSSRCEP